MTGRSELESRTKGTPRDFEIDRGRCSRGAWLDESGIIDLPVSPGVRRVSVNDPFPPCRARLRWPVGYSVRDLADLAEDEAEETNPRRFVYSDAELDAWTMIVNVVLEETIGPQLPCMHARPTCMRGAPLVGPEDHRRWRR